MIQTSIEKAGNLLKLIFAGQVGAQEMRDSMAQLRSMIAELQPGFGLLSDLRDLVSMDLGCVPYIEEVMDLCDDSCIATVVRIIPDPHKDIGLNIMSLFHYRRGVRIVTCETIEEAETALASWRSRSKPQG